MNDVRGGVVRACVVATGVRAPHRAVGAAAAAAAAVAAATAAVGHRPPIAESTRARARARGHLCTAEECKLLSELFQSMVLMAGDRK